MSVLEHQMGNTPMGKNLMNLAMKKDGKTLEQIARNLCAQRGMDFDSEFKAFREKIGY
jgi:translation initiation factor 2 alpha subunit (eIF-2alpha)